MAVLNIDNLSKIYPVGEDMEVAALRGVSLSFEQSEFAAVMGASGSGKSTLLNILGCLDLPSGGSYTLDGVEVARLSGEDLAEVRNGRIGFVFQSFNLLSRTTLEIMNVFQELNDQGMLVIMVTHEPEIGAFTKRIIEMRDGRVIRDEPVENRARAESELARLPADDAPPGEAP